MESANVIKLELSIEANNLKNVAGFMKGLSDPYATISQSYLSTHENKKEILLGRTETIKNSLSPIWTKKFIIDYDISRPSMLNVIIFDEIRKSATDKVIGKLTFPISKLDINYNNIHNMKVISKTLSLEDNQNGSNNGIVTLRFQRVGKTTDAKVRFDVQAKLKNTGGTFATSDPYLELSRQEENDFSGKYSQRWNYSPVYRSKYIRNKLSPHWKSFTILLDLLLNYTNDLNKPIIISVYDYDEKHGNHVLMGNMKSTLNKLIAASNIPVASIPIYNKRGIDAGNIIINKAIITGIVTNPTHHKQHNVSDNNVANNLDDIRILPPPVVPNMSSLKVNDIPSSSVQSTAPATALPIVGAYYAAHTATSSYKQNNPPPTIIDAYHFASSDYASSMPPPMAPSSHAPAPSFVSTPQPPQIVNNEPYNTSQPPPIVNAEPYNSPQPQHASYNSYDAAPTQPPPIVNAVPYNSSQPLQAPYNSYDAATYNLQQNLPSVVDAYHTSCYQQQSPYASQPPIYTSTGTTTVETAMAHCSQQLYQQQHYYNK